MKTLVAKIQRQRLFETGETVVVAVSGGADSVALLDLLTCLAPEKLRLVVAHLNHGLRGAASDGDQDFVSRLAAHYGLPFETQHVDVADLARRCRLSLEDAGRRARYQFLVEAARRHGATSIALAHHRDDQAETVLIRLLRGAGGSGLSAMVNSSQGMLKRPLLQVSRDELEQYLKERGLSYRTDASNADTAILRNSIRHELLPLLRTYNPNIAERLAATAEILAGDEELLEQMTETAFLRVARHQPEGVALRIEELVREPRALRLRLYRRALAELRGDLRHIGLTHLQSVDRLSVSSRPNSRVKLPGACVVARSYGILLFTGAVEPAQADWEIVVAGEGSYDLPSGHRLLVQREPRPISLATGSRRIAFFDAGAAPFPWLLRGFLPGDRFTPLGMNGSQKVKNLFINEKIPLAERRRVPLLVCGGTILWVCGIKMAQPARLTAATGAVLSAEILEITP